MQCPNPEQARGFAIRSAELRSQQATDLAGAIRPWARLLDRFGPTHEAHRALMPLLEKAEAWEELGHVLESGIEMMPSALRGPLLARLGQLRLERLADTGGALAALESSLEANPSDGEARQLLARLVRSDPRRRALRLPSVLERHVRGADSALALEVFLAQADHDRAWTRLEALGQAAELIETERMGAERGLQSAVVLCAKRLSINRGGPDVAHACQTSRLQQETSTNRPGGCSMPWNAPDGR